MNKAVTEGLILMPPPFADGLQNWSSGNGTPGSPSYDGAANAAFVPSDPDFDGCLELFKTQNVQRLRWFGQTPIIPGLYLRVTVRIKALSGALPSARIAGYAANASGGLIGSVPGFAPEVTLDTYGEVVTVSAIIGTGARGGVDMNWAGVAYGHIGLDLTGPNGGLLRIDDVQIEDVTSFWLRDLMDWVDVRDHGAIGDGTSDDRPAFVAASQEAVATGRALLVSEGTYFIGDNLTIEAPVRFQGTLVMDMATRLQLTRSFDFPSYAAAMGSDDLGFRKGVQALFHFTDHVDFDLRGRRVRIESPVDVAALAGLDTFAQRRRIVNGQLDLVPGTAWQGQTVNAQGSYSITNPLQINDVSAIANIPVGARVTGPGVGREIYVRSKSISANRLNINLPLHGGSGTRSYSFEKFHHMIDFSGFERFERFEFADVEFLCKGEAGAINLATDRGVFQVKGCTFNRPFPKAITSTGSGCQGMLVDNCQFLSDEMPLPAQDRVSIAINANNNDVKLRNNRAVRFKHFAILAGSGNIISGNHFFQGDNQATATRTAGLVLTRVNLLTTISANYVDNASIELTNEHSPAPDWNQQFSFGGLSMTGNFFLCSSVGSDFRFFRIKPFGEGHFIQGLQVSGNVFRTLNGTIERVEGIDASQASLRFDRFRNVIWENNAYNGITTPAENPLVLRHDQSTAQNNWTIFTGGKLPFEGWARTVAGFAMEGAPNGPGDEVRTGMPYAVPLQGPDNDRVRLTWPNATRGRVVITIRGDNPL